MVCKGLLNASEIPPKSGAPGFGAGHELISGETPTNASPEAGQGFGAGLTSLQGKLAIARVGIGNQVHAGLVQVLPESFVIAEEKGLVLPDWSA